MERPLSGLPWGALTAGERRGDRTVIRDGGNAVKLWSGVLLRAGIFMIGGTPPLVAFSTSTPDQPLYGHVTCLILGGRA